MAIFMSNLLRWLFVGFALMYSGSAFSNWVWRGQSCNPQAEANCKVEYYPARVDILPNDSSCGGTAPRFVCFEWVGGSPCPSGEVWSNELQQCVSDGEPDCAEKAGEDAGLVEDSPTAPGYEALCYSGCAVEVSEYFQRTDNDNWVIAYRYTGQPCGDGDPLGEPDIPPGEEGPPNIQPNIPPDTDGDGIPDSNDPDIDGDGIPNSEDTDSDGDGIPDIDDPSPLGPGQQEPPSSAHVGSDCVQTPSCSGDAIECAQLVELWRLRCKGGGDTEQVDESFIGNILNDVSGAGVDGLDDVEQAISESIDDPSGIEMPSGFNSYFTSLFPNPSCADITFSYQSRDFTISCVKTADLRTLIAYIMFITTCLYLYNLARKPVGE